MNIVFKKSFTVYGARTTSLVSGLQHSDKRVFRSFGSSRPPVQPPSPAPSSVGRGPRPVVIVLPPAIFRTTGQGVRVKGPRRGMNERREVIGCRRRGGGRDRMGDKGRNPWVGTRCLRDFVDIHPSPTVVPLPLGGLGDIVHFFSRLYVPILKIKGCSE